MSEFLTHMLTLIPFLPHTRSTKMRNAECMNRECVRLRVVWQPRPFALLWKGLASVVSNSCTVTCTSSLVSSPHHSPSAVLEEGLVKRRQIPGSVTFRSQNCEIPIRLQYFKNSHDLRATVGVDKNSVSFCTIHTYL